MKKMFIRGTGRYFPERVVTNDDLTKIMDTSDEWIQEAAIRHSESFDDDCVFAGGSVKLN